MRCADHCWPGRASDSCWHWLCALSLTKQSRKPTRAVSSHVIDLRIQIGPCLQDGSFAIQCCHKFLAFPELPFPLETEHQKTCSSQETAIPWMFFLCPPSPLLLLYSSHSLWSSSSILTFHFYLLALSSGEGHGNPLQCSCLENPMDGEDWWAAIYGVAQSRTQLK